MAEKSLSTLIKSLQRGFGRAGRIAVQDITRSATATTAVFFLRAFYFCKVLGRLRTLEADNAFPVTIDHNLLMLWKKLDRMTLLIKPLSVLEQVAKNSRVLVIGPRNEWDLFLLSRAGFQFDQCTGLDLISYSPKIILGDMHAMPFSDGEFDVVLCGWTLSYSAHPALACAEISRVCRSGGVIGLSVEFFVGSEDDEKLATGGYTIQDSRLDERVNSTDQLLEFFPDHGSVFFDHDSPLKRTVPRDPLPSNCAVLFENYSITQ